MRKVKKYTAETFATENNLLFEETSALYSNFVYDIFEKLVESIYDQKCRLKM